MKSQMPKSQNPEISSDKETEIGRDVSNSIVVTGSGNVIHVSDKKTVSKTSNKRKNRVKPTNAKRKLNVGIVVAIIGLVGTICAALIASPILTVLLGGIPDLNIPPIQIVFSDETPSAIPTQVPTQTTTPVFSTPLPDEVIDIKGVDMVLVPNGEFMMGWKYDDWANQEPMHRVYLDDFYIDKFEVTNALYSECVRDGICQKPDDVKSSTRSSYYGNLSYVDFPVIYVDWYMAENFCEWRGAALPTEAQWEKAAKGGYEFGKYPWGQNSPYDCEYANYTGCIFDTALVASREKGKSNYGVYNLAGNVSEWVLDWYEYGDYQVLEDITLNPQGVSTGEHKGIRGGSWHSTDYELRSYIRHGMNPKSSSDPVGFRCVVNGIPNQ